MSEVRTLNPQALWNNFEDLNAVPRPSKKEERVIAFMRDFGAKLGLETTVDATGNVLIKKSATPGMENRKTVVLQAHLDMVHQKNGGTDFDFDQEGIRSFLDGDWVKAEGTTLGADNGMGVASMMTVLASDDIAHPALEALFTIDEETGMTGAFGLEPGVLSGDILLNLDTEDDDEISVGCAGGIDTNIAYTYQEEEIEDSYIGFTLSLKGLKGGHSGMEIHLGRGNANKLLNRVLHAAELKGLDFRMHRFDGGSLRNAIPREANASILVAPEHEEQFLLLVEAETSKIEAELRNVETEMCFELKQEEVSKTVISKLEQRQFILAIQAVHNGVYRMSDEMEGLVETSSSMARVLIEKGKLIVQGLQRSSIETAKFEIAHTFSAPFELFGAEIEYTGSYPGWRPNMQASILKLMHRLYVEMFKEEPRIQACHAGLECGILGQHYPEMEMISFGPTIRNPHSPDEKVSVSSVQKFWTYFLEVLKEIPVK